MYRVCENTIYRERWLSSRTDHRTEHRVRGQQVGGPGPAEVPAADVAFGIDDLELYGEDVCVEFGWYLRGQITFDGIDPLLVQMAEDVDRTRELTSVGEGRSDLVR